MYKPVPTPPKTDSLEPRLTIGTSPPRPVSDSNAVLTAPQETTVVIAVNSEDEATPKRCSLPSMLAPTRPAACAAGVPCCSAT